MSTFLRNADRIDAALTSWMARNGIRLLRISLGVVFLWFGVLKFFPGLSPAQTLAGDTIAVLSFGLLTPGPAGSRRTLRTRQGCVHTHPGGQSADTTPAPGSPASPRT
jgi:hypothetical protein